MPLEQRLLASFLLSFESGFGLAMLHGSFKLSAFMGSDGLAFDPGHIRGVLSVAPRARQFVGLGTRGLDVVTVPFAGLTMRGSLMMRAGLERTDSSLLAALYSGV